MRGSVVVALLALAACAAKPSLVDAPPPTTIVTGSSVPYSTVTPVQPATQNCREFEAPVTIGGEQKPVYGHACEQPDGSWQIVPSSPTAPVIESTTVYHEYAGPWWPGPWWGAGFVAGVGIHHHHRHR